MKTITMLAITAAAAALTACGDRGDDANNSADMNAGMTDLNTVDMNAGMDMNATGDVNAADGMNATENAMVNDATHNDADTNLANGM